MAEHREQDNREHNSIYYNQMLRASERKTKDPRHKIKKDFASQDVDFTKYLIVPKGYEGIAYTLYILIIPYIVGLTFLFFYVAHGAYESFSLLDLSSFMIIWAIGYEITGAIILTFIFFAFLKHLKH
ncbi:MAG: hypothetical protein Q9M32_02400 [Sulfurimonas sp.]|nr:hypothetical protein [Sulfurimonas sp.]MDQ7061177.1 hypothetical protein [Sulfurimonas sp.]